MKSNNFKAGIFVLITMVLLVIMILKISQGGLIFSKTYYLYMDINSAVGLAKNSPVQIAGVDIGIIEDILLTNRNTARLKLSIRDDIRISRQASGNIKTTGILGDAYVEIMQGESMTETLKDGDVITDVTSFGDINSVTGQIAAIATDVKAITAQMRKLMAGDGSTFDNTMKNIEKISNSLSNVTSANEDNINVIIANMKALSQNLNYMVARNMGRVDSTFYNLDDITGTISRGEGTIGQLVKDDKTINKLNETLEGINDFLGGANRLKVDLGMHSEYLAGTGDFKNYVSLSLKPRPDKYFLLEVMSDPDPSFETGIEETIVTSGATSNKITTKTRTKKLDGFMFSAQIAKKIHDFTIRGGLIESSGGIGVDYDKGIFGLSFSAFDFKSDEGQKPHLKAMGRTQVSHNFYFLGGVDDFINTNQDLAWFLGAGLSFTDDDIKSLLGIMTGLKR
ncbi:MAG: MCE family protein [Deltaproteobacteria bacterium]|nr:MCE family protein [Deltaproteobacteria bacterium]